MTALGEAFVPIRATLDKLDSDLAEAKGKIEGALGGIGQSVQALGGLALAGIATGIVAVGAALAGIGTFAFNAGMMVDDAMDSIAISTGATGDELAGLQDSFETVFSTVPTDAGTAADVIGTLNARLGITGDELTDLATPLAQVTELIGGDAVARTELFTRVMGDWGVEVGSGAALLDTFFTAQQQTGAGMDDLMAKVVQFGSPLRLMGFGLEESIALFAQWEQQGVNSELVMGSLRIAAGHFAESMGSGMQVVGGGVANLEAANVQLLELTVALEKAEAKQARLNETGSAAEQALNAMDVADYRAQIEQLTAAMSQGEFVYEATAEGQATLRDRLIETMEAIQGAGSEAEALSIAMDVFGARAGPDMAAAILEGRFAIDDLMAAMQGSEGVIMDTAAQTADFGEMFTLLKNKAQLALAPIGAMLIGLANQIMPLVEQAFAWFETTLVPVIERVAGAFETFFGRLLEGGNIFDNLGLLVWDIGNALGFTDEVMEPLVERLWEFFSAAGALMERIAEFLAPILEAIAGFVSWKDVLAALGIAIAAVVIPAIGSLLATIAPVLLVAAALVAGIALVRNAWENDWGGIRTKLTEVWEGTIKPALETLQQWLSVNVPIALEALRTFWVDVAWPAILGAVQWFQENVVPILQTIWDWLSVNVPVALETLRAFWVETAWPAIQNAIAIVWPIIEGIFIAIRDWVVNTLIPTVQDLYLKWTTEWWPQIQTALENAWKIIEEIFGEIGRWINDNIVPWVVFLMEEWGKGFDAVKTKLEEVWEVIEPIWIALKEWLAVKIPEALHALQPIFEGVMSGINAAVQPVKDLWDAFVDAVQRFWDWITNHEFSFDINLPDLPDYAVPGSPLPLHTAWKDFADFIKTTKMELAFSVPAMDSGLRTEEAPATSGPGGNNNEFHLHLEGAAGESKGVMRDFALLRGLVGMG